MSAVTSTQYPQYVNARQNTASAVVSSLLSTIERVSSNNSANTSWHWILSCVNFFFQTISCMLIGRKYDIKVVMNSTGITLSAGYKITTNICFNFTGQRFHLYKYRYGFSLLQSNALTNAQSTWNLAYT